MWVGTRDSGILKVGKRSKKVEARYSDSPSPDGYNSLADPTPTVFTGIRILDENRTEIPLYSHGNRKIVLDPDQNFFIVSFSAPDMSNPEQMHFECRLDGLKDIWHDASAIRSTIYTNVPAGNYKLLVRHTNSDGSWTEPADIDLEIRPHWYATTWMMSIWRRTATSTSSSPT